MRMHEILGVEPFEKFQVVGGYEGRNYSLDKDGWMRWGDSNWESDVEDVYNAINNGIIRKPRLTWEQFIILKAVKMLGCNWFTKDDDGRIEGWEIKPRKTTGAWVEGVGDTLKSCFVNLAGAKAMKIEQIITYDEPLDIVQTLKDAEVEG